MVEKAAGFHHPRLDAIEHRLTHYQPRRLDGERRRAAVLVGLLEGSSPRLLLTQRHASLRLHAGQVAFPGGKQDAHESLMQCALREALEETGLRAEQARIIGQLDEVISLHGVAVTPFVARISPSVELAPNPGEVAAIFSIPLDYLAQDPRVYTDCIQFQERPSLYIPAYSYEGYTLWGLSAMITANLLHAGMAVDISLLRAPSSTPLRHLGDRRPSRYPVDYFR